MLSPNEEPVIIPGQLRDTSQGEPRLHVYHATSQTYTFQEVRSQMILALLNSKPINRNSWQTLDVSRSPAHDTYELRNVHMFYDVPEYSWTLSEQIKPDLPWAEDHFLERVSGEPLNPAPSYEWWPHHHGSADRHVEQAPREIDERDWAYLAALIDGDGTISFMKNSDRPRIQVSQKDHGFIEQLQVRYGFGDVTYRDRDDVKGPDGQVRRSNPAVWSITSKALTRYVLEHILPYLMLKRDLAEKGLRGLNSLSAHHSDKPLEMEDAKFSHTYPERFWPRYAANAQTPRRGIRYEYGDLSGVVKQLKANGLTRQAYLPVWHPEDTGATDRRVPCSIGYHFMVSGNGTLDMWYQLRACDFARHFHNDCYLAARLLQYVCSRVSGIRPGQLNLTISSLHLFRADADRIVQEAHDDPAD